VAGLTEAEGVGLATTGGAPDWLACAGSRVGSGVARDVDGEGAGLLDGLAECTGRGVGLLEGLGEGCLVVGVAALLEECVGLLVGVGEDLGFVARFFFFTTGAAAASGCRKTSATQTTPFLTTTPIPSCVYARSRMLAR
jgi:hypothetical protein